MPLPMGAISLAIDDNQDTTAINQSMSQPGHYPRGYNPMTYQHHYQWAQSR